MPAAVVLETPGPARLTCSRGPYGSRVSDEREAEAWNAAVEAMEREEVEIPARLAPSRRRRGGRPMFGTVVSAVLALLFGVLLGRRHR